MKKISITQERLAAYQSEGYWKGLTLGMCREYESEGYWPGVTLYDYFEESVRKFPERVFVAHSGKRFTYGETQDIVLKLTAGFIQMGIGKGDVICALLHNCPEMAFLQLSLSRIGAIIQPIHLVYREHEIRKRIAFCDARAIIIPHEIKGFNYVDMIMGMEKDLPLEHIFVVGENVKESEKVHTVESIWKSATSTQGKKEYLDRTDVDANDVLLLNFTSGTETEPKGFLHTHNTLLGNLHTAAFDISGFVPGEEVLLSFSPMTHSFGHAITYIACMCGATIVMVDTYDPGKTLELVQAEKITFLQGTPTHFLRFLEHPGFNQYNLNSLRILATGGAAIPPALTQRLRKETSAALTVWFGMGEDGIHTAIRPGEEEEKYLETVGSVLPGEELAIFDDDARQLKQGEVGEIGNRGAAMFLGYFRNPEKTDDTRNQEGWFFTGDTGFVGEDGYLRLYGRKKDLINRGGSKIFPLTIENALGFHPKIQSVAVVGVPDTELGERVCACVIPVKNQTVTREDVIQYLRDKGYGRYEIPERVELMDDFPMTPTGKVKKDLLQKRVVKEESQLMSKIFEPVKIGKMELKNRICRAPCLMAYCTPEGYVTSRMVRHYRTLARGGAGLITVGVHFLHSSARVWPGQEKMGTQSNRSLITDDSYIPGMKMLAEAIHEEGAKASLQICHTGKYSEAEIVSAPSDTNPFMWRPDQKIKEMTLEDIDREIENFVQAARRIKEAGFDAVTIHGAHGFMPQQFMSPYSNIRTDKYGKDRMLFSVELVQRIRTEVGPDFPIIFRMSGEERLEEVGKQGYTVADLKDIAPRLEEAGVDCLDVSIGVPEVAWVSFQPHYYPRGCILHLAEAVKKLVNIPVIGVGRINSPEVAISAIEEGKCDIVALGRALIADPEFPNKMREGRYEDINKCLACMHCIDHSGAGVECAVNPSLRKRRGVRYKDRTTRIQEKGAGGGRRTRRDGSGQGGKAERS